jgi:hypothetical protein
MEYNIDQLAEPFSIVLEGKTYIVGKVTAEVISKISAIGGDNKSDMSAPVKQLALFLGETEEVLNNIDIRKIAKALSIIQKNILKDIDDPKN